MHVAPNISPDLLPPAHGTFRTTAVGTNGGGGGGLHIQNWSVTDLGNPSHGDAEVQQPKQRLGNGIRVQEHRNAQDEEHYAAHALQGDH